MLYQNKYRAESARLVEWDYSNSAWYYVTICTKGMERFFGDATGEIVELSPAGKIVHDEWMRTVEIRKNVDLDEFVIMPNHLHGIIIINDQININVETTRRVVSKEMNKIMDAETTQRLARPHGGVVSADNDSKTLSSNSLGSIIGQFKSATTKRIRKECNRDFAWQPRFYDHIIRNEKSLFAIRKYIYPVR